MASYIRFVVRESLVQSIIILFNLIAVASFFFVQVGSIFLIVPAAIIDVAYMLSRERIGPRKDSIQPSSQIIKLALYIILVCLVVFSAIFFLEILRSN